MRLKKITLAVYFLAMALFVGCDGTIKEDEKFYTMAVEKQRLNEINSIDLNKFESEPLPEVKPIYEVPENPQGKVELTLEECRAIALQENLDIKVQMYNPELSEQRINAEKAKFESSFTASLYKSKTDQPIAQPLALSASQGDSRNYNLGVNMPLQTGGNLSFNLADSRMETNRSSDFFNPGYNSNFSLSISQPILKNAGVRVNRNSIRIAEYDKNITDAGTKLEVIRVVAAIDRVYWRVYAAFKQLEVKKQQLELAQSQLDRAKRFVEAGQHSQIEIIRAEAGMASTLESIIIADNLLRDRQRSLKQALNKAGLETSTDIAIIPQSEPNPLRYNFTKEVLVPKAMENRMEMLELELQIAKDISNIDFYRNQALPLVTLDYRYGVNGLGESRSDSYDLLTDKNYEDHRIGLNLMIPLGNKVAKSNLRQAAIMRRQRLMTKANRESLIEVEVLNAMDTLEANWQRILASRQSSLLEERLYKAEIRAFENGMSTSTDILEAQTRFANAQSSEINALTEYQISLIDLAYATGTLLGASDIEIDSL